MKHCHDCGKALPDLVQQFGPPLRPLCWECYSGDLVLDAADRDAPEPAQEAAWYEQVMEVEE